MTTPRLTICSELLSQIIQEVVRCHPHEACGFLLGKILDCREAQEFVACQNIQDECHQSDPDRFPRTAKTAYVIDAKEQARVREEAQKKELSVLAIVHSHPEHDVYFSEEDKKNAAPWGEPLFENLSYVVVSVYGKTIKGISDFVWDETKKDFLEEEIQWRSK